MKKKNSMIAEGAETLLAVAKTVGVISLLMTGFSGIVYFCSNGDKVEAWIREHVGVFFGALMGVLFLVIFKYIDKRTSLWDYNTRGEIARRVIITIAIIAIVIIAALAYPLLANLYNSWQ